MSIEEIYSLEKQAVSQTISGYTVDAFIKSYAEQLVSLKLPEDYNKIKVIVDRLLKWYLDNYKTITDSKFVMNKESHYKSIDILKEIKEQLDIYKAD